MAVKYRAVTCLHLQAANRPPTMKKKVECDRNIETLSDITEEQLLQEIQERGYFIAKNPTAKTGKTFKTSLHRWAKGEYRFGVVSDTHLGSRQQQLTHLWAFYELCKKRRIDTIFHVGDLVDGEKMHVGQEYEIFVHGADAQRKYAIKNYPKIKGIKTKIISGNHDASFMKSGGYDIVSAVCEERSDMDYLGSTLAFVEFSGIRVGLMHGSGGVAYARSYKVQKVIEQIAPPKPNMFFLGHYHLPVILNGYRNVESVQLGCFQAQTPYLTAKGLYPFVAGLIVNFRVDKSGLASVTYESIPFYVPVKDDY